MARPAPADAEHFSKEQITRGSIIAGHLTTMPAYAEADFSIRNDERPEMRRLVSAILTNELTREAHSKKDFERIKKLTEEHDLMDIGAMLETYTKLFDDVREGGMSINLENLRSFGQVFLTELLPTASLSSDDIPKATLTAFAGMNRQILSEKVSKEFRKALLTGCAIIGPGELHFQRPKSFDGNFEVTNEAGEKVEVHGDFLLNLYTEALGLLITTFIEKFVDRCSAMPEVSRNGRNFKITNLTPPFIAACLNSEAMKECEFGEKLSRHVNEILAEEKARDERHRVAEAKNKRREENRRRMAEEAEAEEKRRAEEVALLAQQARIEAEQEAVKRKVIADAEILKAARIERENKEAGRQQVEAEQEAVKEKVIADAEILKAARIERETKEIQRQQKEISDRVVADAEKLAEESKQLSEARKNKTVVREGRGGDESRFKFARGPEAQPPLGPDFLRDVRAIVEEDEKSKDRG